MTSLLCKSYAKVHIFQHTAIFSCVNLKKTFLLVDALLVAAMLAVSLLPNITIGDWREPRATTSNGTTAVCSLNRDVGSCREVVMFCTLCSLGISKYRYSSDHCHQHGETKKQLLHNLMHCSVSCATSNCYY